MTDPADLISDVLNQNSREAQALRLLLAKELAKQDHFLACTAHMGRTRSYLTTASMKWVAANMGFATDLPLFKEHRDENRNVVVNKETIAELQQRRPDFSRQYEMTMYLAYSREHKFPTILAVMTQDWVDEDQSKSDKWDSDGRALRDSIDYTYLDDDKRIAQLNMSTASLLYALDGQHRLLAIQGLIRLCQGQPLEARRKDGTVKATPPAITKDMLIESGNFDAAYFEQLVNERIGIEMIPAVIKGETRNEALQRIRRIFVDLNRNAKPLTKGQITLLNDDNGFAVVAKACRTSHSLLTKAERVDDEKTTIGKSSKSFTTLECLHKMAEGLLAPRHPFSEWSAKHGIWIRPPEDELDLGTSELASFLDHISQIGSVTRMIQGTPATQIREDEQHALWRPFTQMALAEAVGRVVGQNLWTLDAIMQRVAEKDDDGAFHMTEPSSPFYGVVWDPIKDKVRTSSNTTCVQLLEYLLGGGFESEAVREKLRSAFASQRIIDESGQAMSLDGEYVLPDAIKLPDPWC